MLREVTFELKTQRERNQRGASRGADQARWAREREQRQTTRRVLAREFGAPPPLHILPTHDRPAFTLDNEITVTLTRMAPGKLDDDGPDDALKNVRDGVADWLLVKDDHPQVHFLATQGEPTAPGVYLVKITIEDKIPGEPRRIVCAMTAEHRRGELVRVHPKRRGAKEGQVSLPLIPSFATLPWEQSVCASCGGGLLETEACCGACKGTGRGPTVRAPLPRFAGLDDPPREATFAVPAEHAARYPGGKVTLHRRPNPTKLKGIGLCWIYEQRDERT